MNVLIVRLGALGDIVHAIPAAAALRAALPGARIDWLVEAKHRSILDLVTVLDRVVALEGRTLRAWTDAVRRARQARYDVAFDFQGLMKSAVLARASGASRVAGFSIWHLREKTARPFYSETDDTGDDEAEHVIQKNLHLLQLVGVQTPRIEFPLAAVASRALDEVRREIGPGAFALVNPGAAWPNKRWPPSRFGEVAAFLREVRGLPSIVLWGPGEQAVAQAVVAASNGAARLAPPTDDPRPGCPQPQRRADRVGRYRSVAHRRGGRHARGGTLRSDQSASQRPMGARRCDRVEIRRMRVPLRAQVSREPVVPREHQRGGSDGGDPAASRSWRRC